jgi:predicted transcriptional regulator
MALFNKRKRDKYDIYHDILKACKSTVGGINKTRLMYSANLTFEVANKYLPLLEKSGLIARKDNLYFITKKGEEVLQKLTKFKEIKGEMKEIIEKLKEELPP